MFWHTERILGVENVSISDKEMTVAVNTSMATYLREFSDSAIRQLQGRNRAYPDPTQLELARTDYLFFAHFSKILIDPDGIISISLGAYGVPETFLLNNKSKIIKKYIGPLTENNISEIIKIIK